MAKQARRVMTDEEASGLDFQVNSSNYCDCTENVYD